MIVVPPKFRCVWLAAFLAFQLAPSLPAAPGVPPKSEYRRYALLREGDVQRGRQLFNNEERSACSKCHSVDGSASKAGPDLFAVGDKFARREIIEAVLWPSTNIAVGYSTTTVETRAGDDFQGILKQATDAFVELLGADAKRVRIATADIREQHTSEVSLMPEELQAGLSLQEFGDLIEYLVSLKQRDSAEHRHHGMPREIPALARPVGLRAIHSDALRFEHPVWFGPIPGAAQTFAVVEHETGKIWRLEASAEHESKTVFADLGHCDRGTRGLIGLVFHPQFASNGRYFTAKGIGEGGRFATIIAEWQAARDLKTDSGHAPKIVMTLDAASNVHYGGSLQFGPDGYLYIGMGDTGPQEDPHGHGQNLSLLRGKIMRVDVDHGSNGAPYVVPADNPFVGRAGVRPEIWAYGFREPWRFSFDPVTRELWVGDVGQDRYEEVDIVRRGENYGWNVYEGFEPFSNRYRRPGESFVPPVFAYARKFGPSVTGGFVYRANPRSSFYGVYIFGDHESHRIFGLTQENRVLKKIRQVAVAPQRVVSFGLDAAGELYVVGYEGTIYKMELNETAFE